MTEIRMEAAYIPSEDVVAREIEGELIIVPLAAGIGDLEDELYTLNETGKHSGPAGRQAHPAGDRPGLPKSTRLRRGDRGDVRAWWRNGPSEDAGCSGGW